MNAPEDRSKALNEHMSSGFAPRADIVAACWHVRFVPIVLQKSPSGLYEVEICNYRIGAPVLLNRCCAFQPDLESIFLAEMLKILLQHNRYSEGIVSTVANAPSPVTLPTRGVDRIRGGQIMWGGREPGASLPVPISAWPFRQMPMPNLLRLSRPKRAGNAQAPWAIASEILVTPPFSPPKFSPETIRLTPSHCPRRRSAICE